VSFAGRFNAFESVFWIVIGLVVYWRSHRLSGASRKVGAVAAAAFFLFGVSDVFEIASGAWWRPWPLLLLKVACVAVLAGCLAARKRAWRGGGANVPDGTDVNEVKE